MQLPTDVIKSSFIFLNNGCIEVLFFKKNIFLKDILEQMKQFFLDLKYANIDFPNLSR